MQSKGVGNENHRGTTLGAMRKIDNRYGFIAVRGHDERVITAYLGEKFSRRMQARKEERSNA